MKKQPSFIKELHDLEQSIFKEFALETSNNIHIEAVDLNNPLTSIYKILLCDIITTQMYSKSATLPVILPSTIFVKDQDSGRCSYLEFNDAGHKYLQSLFDTLTDKNKKNKIHRFRKAVLNNSPSFYSNKILSRWKLLDVEIDTTVEDQLNTSKPIEFNNRKYPKIRVEEIVNYTIKITHTVHGKKDGFNDETINIFLTKVAALALHTKRNKRNFSEIEKQATKAAISQVMARNTSHNIGAHVMNKLIGDLRSLELLLFEAERDNYKSTSLKELHKSIIDRLENDNWFKTASNELQEKAIKNEILLAQISLFNNYVKCRMDYLADVSFGTLLMQTNKYAYEDLFKRLDEVRLLLEHISGLSDFKYKIEFRKNGKRFRASKVDDNDTEAAEDDLLVAIPNDILGTQAFYNILENIIRNTAKHSSLKPDITIFTINFIDRLPSNEEMDFCQCENSKECNCGKPTPTEIQNILNEFVAVEVYDNIPVVGAVRELSGEEKKEYKEIMRKELEPFKEKIDEIVFAQNKKLNEDILHENKLRSYSLGLVEMDASAAYLRKRPVEYINHPSYNIQYDESWSRDTELNGGNQEIRGINCRHFLKAFKTKEEFEVNIKDKNTKVAKKGSALGYRFFLHRPAVVLVVTKLLKDDKEKKEKLKKEGIWLIEPKEFEKELADGKVYPHEFVIHTDLKDCVTKVKIKDVETEVNLLEYFKTSLPIRILDVNNDDLNTILETNAEKIICDCWSRWFDKLRDKNQCSNHSNDHGELFYSIKGTYNEYACHSIVLIDHLYKEDGTQDIEKAKIIWCELEGEKCHAEALSSLAQSKLPDYYKIVNQKCKNEKVGKELLKCYLNNLPIDTKEQIAESAFAKVVVIDERIQEAAQSRNFMTIKFDKLYDKMNVIIPKKDVINLSANSYDTALINKLNKYLGLPLEGNEECNEIENATIGLNSSDFMLIHYSIFERMFKKEDINGKLEDIAKRGINVVVTSGRGTPENLTPKARFVNLSSVINSFVDIRSKYLINYLLNSSRKSNKI